MCRMIHARRAAVAATFGAASLLYLKSADGGAPACSALTTMRQRLHTLQSDETPYNSIISPHDRIGSLHDTIERAFSSAISDVRRHIQSIVCPPSVLSTVGASTLSHLASRDPATPPSFEDAMNDVLAQAFGPPPSQQPQGPIQPRPQQRNTGSIPASRKILYFITGSNLAVYLMWKVPSMSAFMQDYFITSASSLFRGWKGMLTNLTCTYSHIGILHLGLNMMGLLSFGPRLMEGRHTAQAPKMSPSEFFAFYTVSGFAASIASNTLNVYARVTNPSLGASGAIFGVLSYFCMSYPDAGIAVFFIPMSASTGLLLGSAINLYLVGKTVAATRFRVPPPAVDGMAHLAGTAMGIAYYYFKRGQERSRPRGLIA